MAEGARLESVYTATYRGFESPPHRHIQGKSSYESTGFFLLYPPDRGDENPRPGVDNWRQSVGQTERAANRLPAGRAKRVNSPLTAIFKVRARTKVRAFFFYIPRTGGDENPRPGFDNWRQPVGQTERAANRLPAGRATRVNPPLTAIFKMRARTKVRAFFFYIPRTGGMRIPDRGSTTGDSQLDRLSAQRTGCPQGERSESIPPSPPYSR